MDNVRHLEPRDPADSLARTPPHDIEAEQTVLGSCIVTPRDIEECIEIIDGRDFYRPQHETIWHAITSLAVKGAPTDPIALTHALTASGDLARIGGPAYLHTLTTYAMPNAAYYAEIIRERSRRRRIVETGLRIAQVGYDPSTDLATVIEIAREQVTEATSDHLGAGAGPFADRLIPGGSFILDRPDTVPALWGDGEQVLWAESEALLIAGPAGVGKTTVAQQVLLAAIGIRPHALGMPVRRFERVLYLASDRPQQAARSFQRMVTPDDRTALDKHLTFWPGPPPADFIKDPGMLLRLCQAASADVVCLDSLKDMAGELASEEGGQAINSAIQRTLVEGIEVIGLHHHRKQGGGKEGGKEPTSLDELYGSTWITAGAGSVVSLWGAAGEPIVSMRHLKQPAGECGPWKLRHDHPRGMTEVWHQVDILGMLRAAGPAGLTPLALAVNLFPNPKGKPTPSEVEKARRRLDEYVEKRLAVVHKLGNSKTAPSAYFAAFDEQGVLPDED